MLNTKKKIEAFEGRLRPYVTLLLAQYNMWKQNVNRKNKRIKIQIEKCLDTNTRLLKGEAQYVTCHLAQF